MLKDFIKLLPQSTTVSEVLKYPFDENLKQLIQNVSKC